MKRIKKIIQDAKLNRTFFGPVKSLLGVLDGLINLVVYFDCLKIMVLPRNNLVNVTPGVEKGMTFRFATLSELETMQAEGNWEINTTKIEHYKQGDVCLLYFIKDILAGYQWAHLQGRPEIMKNLRLHFPPEYIYNYAGFTKAKFRGKKLGSYGHRSLLNQPDWKNKKGLICYTKLTNWRSIRSLSYSGYVAIGVLWLVRVKGRYLTWVSPEARQFNISVAANSTHSTRVTEKKE